MTDLRRLLGAAGEGLLAGFAAGALFGSWELVVSQDVAHGLLRLATYRMAAALTTGALAGGILSTLVHLLLDWLRRRGSGWHRIGTVLLVAGWAVALLLVAFPLRDTFFRMRIFSTRSLFLTIFFSQAVIAAHLLWRRCRETRPGSSVVGARPRHLGPALAGGGLLLSGVLTLGLVPRLPLADGATGRPVILVSLDTLRADRVGFLGNRRGLTPHLDTLAGEGAVFEQAHSPAPWTLPAHASVFTSLLPYDHKCRWDNNAVGPRHATLAERFRNAGYRTAAFTGGGYVSRGFGFNHGFEIYQEYDEIRIGGPQGIVDAALRWVRDRRDEPFFLFVHTYEVHSPWRRTGLADHRDAGRLPEVFGDNEIEAIREGTLVLTPRERAYVTDLYDGGVAHADRVIGQFLETLRREGTLDRAILMIISDHGEELWERYSNQSPGHGHSLYQELQHIPWLVRAPGIVPAGLRLRSPVSLLDVSPTIQEVTGLAWDPEQQGASLAKSMLEGVEPEAKAILMESVEYGPDRFAMRTGDFKVILTPSPDKVNSRRPLTVPTLQVFNLADDPGESRDLSGSLDDATRRMTQTLHERVRRVSRPDNDTPGELELPEKLRRQLESLGYIR